jgi:hypothetical protein
LKIEGATSDLSLTAFFLIVLVIVLVLVLVLDGSVVHSFTLLSNPTVHTGGRLAIEYVNEHERD